ncbi:MAG: hypothetical protein CMD16_02180 [Flavobacteriales bacterium]|nr:hypothetical protein [Flavobacteriales bacterium]
MQCVWQQTYTNFILYVIDNASIDNTKEILDLENESRLVLINNQNNLGVARANNQGILRAIEDDCSQILIINNDVEFDSDLIEKLMKLQKDKDCSLVSPKMMYYDKPDHIWYAGSWFKKSKGYLPLHRGQMQIDKGQFDKVVEIEYAPTCCLLVKKQVFIDLGFMNEKYFVYFDDTDFLYRVFKDGRHKMYYYPFVKFYHKVGSLTKSFNQADGMKYRGDFFIQQNTRNHVFFLKQVGGVFSYLFIIWLFFKINIRFVTDSTIRKDRATWQLINKSYFQGLRM